jgi:TPP-dependent pyruvate/acetoin dehydrogenase alpha subunit
MKSAAHDRPGRTTISAVGDGVLLQNPASNSPESSLKLDRSALLRAYGIMRTIREFEERLVQMEAAAARSLSLDHDVPSCSGMEVIASS